MLSYFGNNLSKAAFALEKKNILFNILLKYVGYYKKYHGIYPAIQYLGRYLLTKYLTLNVSWTRTLVGKHGHNQEKDISVIHL